MHIVLKAIVWENYSEMVIEDEGDPLIEEHGDESVDREIGRGDDITFIQGWSSISLIVILSAGFTVRHPRMRFRQPTNWNIISNLI